MKKTIYKYIFYEFLRYFTITLFALTAIIWTIQAVNFLDLVTDDGHAFGVYFLYSFLTIPKIITKVIPFTFLIASILTILKLEKDNELIVLWTSGLNKMFVVNLFIYISILVMLGQIIMTTIITPTTLNHSRTLLKNSKLQFVPSLLKEKRFNDSVKGLTIFVNKKNENGIYENIFIRDDSNVLSAISAGSSTIFAKSGYVSSDEKNLILLDGNIQKLESDNKISIIKFEKTFIYLSELSTKSISETKIQETSTFYILGCALPNIVEYNNCNRTKKNLKDIKIEINKRFGMPVFVPLVSLIVCFLLSSRKETKLSGLDKYLFFVIGFIILSISEVTVRYSGNSLTHTTLYYFIPFGLSPVLYFFLIRNFKYENLKK